MYAAYTAVKATAKRNKHENIQNSAKSNVLFFAYISKISRKNTFTSNPANKQFPNIKWLEK